MESQSKRLFRNKFDSALSRIALLMTSQASDYVCVYVHVHVKANKWCQPSLKTRTKKSEPPDSPCTILKNNLDRAVCQIPLFRPVYTSDMCVCLYWSKQASKQATC